MNPAQLRGFYSGLRSLTDHCAEALATLHADNGVDQQHFENMLDINREVWSLRWEVGLLAGQETPSPSPAEGANEIPNGEAGGAA